MKRIDTEAQNSDVLLGRLAAMTHHYTWAKRLVALQLAVAVAGAAAIAVAMAVFPAFTAIGSVLCFIITALDALVLDRLVASSREQAAKCHELFDRELFQLPWPAAMVGDQPANEDLAQDSRGYLARPSTMGRLRNWYPACLFELPMELARIACQRASLWWDAALRRRLVRWYYGLGIAFAIAVLLVVFFSKQSVEQAMVLAFAPVAPALIWFFREAHRHHEVVELRERGRVQLEAIWQQALNGNADQQLLRDAAMDAQWVLYYTREQGPLVFTWFYTLFRSKQQLSMEQCAKQLVLDTMPKLADLREKNPLNVAGR